MAETSTEEICAFHYTTKSDEKCAYCGLPICKLDEYYNPEAKRICALCNNSPKATKLRKYIQIGTMGITLAVVVIVFWVVPSEYQLWSLLGLIPLMIALLFGGNRLLSSIAYGGLEKDQMILPLIRYFEASANPQFYKLFLKNLKKLTDEEKEEIKKPIFDYLVPAILFNYSKLDDDWQEDLLKLLSIEKLDLATVFIKDYRVLLINIAVHDAKAELSKFIFYLGEITEDETIIVDYIKEISSPALQKLDDDTLRQNYDKLLEDLFLYDDEFYQICDKLNLAKEKEAIKNLLSRYEPPAVPKSAMDAIKQQRDEILAMQKQGLVSSKEDYELASEDKSEEAEAPSEVKEEPEEGS